MSITKGPGGYKVRYYEAGRGSRRRSKTFRRLKDAETFENDVARRQALGELQLLEGGGKTLHEVTEEWWELHAEPNLAPQTLQNYSEVLDNLLMPQLGSRRLRDLSVESVERFRADLERQGLGRHRVRRSMIVLQSILQSAVRRGLIGRNVAREARKPSGRRKRAVVCPAPAAIEAIRCELLEADRHGDAALVSTLAYAGLRPQEALALEWRHVGERTLLVEQKNLDGTVVAGQKTARIARAVDLCGPLAEDSRRLAAALGAEEGPRLPEPRRQAVVQARRRQLAPPRVASRARRRRRRQGGDALFAPPRLRQPADPRGALDPRGRRADGPLAADDAHDLQPRDPRVARLAAAPDGGRDPLGAGISWTLGGPSAGSTSGFPGQKTAEFQA